MKQIRKSQLPILLLVASFVLALGFRLILLGERPLSDSEAYLALQALSVAHDQPAIYDSQAAYTGLTGLLFFVFTASNFLARFWPAVIGACGVLVPWLFRKTIGLWPAIILSAVIAISPEMVALSRIIGSPLPAMILIFLTLGFYLNRNPGLAGMTFALGLMSGPGFWIGILIIVGTFFLAKALSLLPLSASDQEEKPSFHWRRAGVSSGITILIAGTAFTLAPANLSGVLAGLTTFVKGFTAGGDIPGVVFLVALIGYSAGALLIGFIAGIRSILVKSNIDRALFLGAGISLLVVWLYPASKPAHLIWVTVPLWALTVRFLVRSWQMPVHSRWLVVISALVTVLIFAFMLMAFRSMLNQIAPGAPLIDFLLAIVGGIVLLVAVTLLVNYGWGSEHGLAGLILGLSVVISLSLLAVSVRAAGLTLRVSQDLWYPEEERISTRWLRISLDEISSWHSRTVEPLETAVVAIDSPAMRWFLRNELPVSFVPYLMPSSMPAFLITKKSDTPAIAGSYRGQDLTWSRQIAWDELSATDYLRWVLTHSLPEENREIILWVRTDLMPDAQFSP